jgi:hypothetical protein
MTEAVMDRQPIDYHSRDSIESRRKHRDRQASIVAVTFLGGLLGLPIFGALSFWVARTDLNLLFGFTVLLALLSILAAVGGLVRWIYVRMSE